MKGIFWKRKEVSKTIASNEFDGIDPFEIDESELNEAQRDELSRMRLDILLSDVEELSLIERIRERFDVQLYLIFDELLPYSFYIGIRAVVMWFILQISLPQYYGPPAFEWLLSIAFAQILVGIRYVEKLQTRRRLFIGTVIVCALFARFVMAGASHLYLTSVVILWIVPFYYWISEVLGDAGKEFY